MNRFPLSGTFSLLVLGLAAAVGCGSSQPSLPDADSLVTIQQGVYGITTSQDDVGDNPVRPMGGFSILVYDHVPRALFDQNLTPTKPSLVETHSDQAGFYQLAMDSGRYVFCSSFLRCVWLDVPAGQRVRLDYCYDMGPGWSQGEFVQR